MVMVKSFQGQSMVKSAQTVGNNLFLLFLLTLCSFEMYIMA